VERAPRYPVALAVAGRRCVVVGGGRVAARKAASLLDAGAAVHIVSPALGDELAALAEAGRVTVDRRAYRPGDLRGAFLAIAATDARAVNAAVAAEARAERALVTVCDDPAASDLVGVAAIRRGRLTVTVSTEGDSPALARLVREELERFLTPEYAALLELAAAERRAIGRGSAATAPASWREAMTPELLALLRAGETEAARRRLRAALDPEAVGAAPTVSGAGAAE
jgi:precorrin-2 dehydrogenase/sirohydrochlorin ferrochelatase